jgi:hypothetical protein
LVRDTSISSPNIIDVGGAAVALAIRLVGVPDFDRHPATLPNDADQLRRIAELNHHIRNALQVIAYHHVPERNAQTIQQVNVEVLRIESGFREVSAAVGAQKDFPAAILPIERGQG